MIQNFTFRSHISAVCSSCFYHMRDLRRTRCHLDLDSAKLLATALLPSRLDYCNSRLYGIADIDLTRLHRVQNQPDALDICYDPLNTQGYNSKGC